MLPDLDSYRSAQVIVKCYGEDAPIEGGCIELRPHGGLALTVLARKFPLVHRTRRVVVFQDLF